MTQSWFLKCGFCKKLLIYKFCHSVITFWWVCCCFAVYHLKSDDNMKKWATFDPFCLSCCQLTWLVSLISLRGICPFVFWEKLAEHKLLSRFTDLQNILKKLHSQRLIEITICVIWKKNLFSCKDDEFFVRFMYQLVGRLENYKMLKSILNYHLQILF